ncbi:MAG: DUF2333 family protein [Rhodospirillaceae bacterium]|nr:DUF2333 family protein [Rhodospirillaceae bacterium]
MAKTPDPLDRLIGDRPSRWQRLRARIDRLFVKEDEDGTRRRRFLPWVLGVFIAIIAYYLIGAVLTHVIDDDPDYKVAAPTAGGSLAVDMAASLIRREVDEHGWTANDPVFYPGWILDNKPNYQQGIIYALSRFAIEMSDQIGRARGSSQVDSDLDEAAGLLRYPGDRWVFDPSSTLAPTATADSQYRSAADALLRYNRRLAAGEAVLDLRADNLLATLERMSSDLGSSSATIAEHLATQGGWIIDTHADDIFYSVKGRLYGYTMILQALSVDFAEVIETHGLQAVWAQMMASLHDAIALSPWIVISGDPDSQALPSHLAGLGFYLLRARTQMREVTNVLEN